MISGWAIGERIIHSEIYSFFSRYLTDSLTCGLDFVCALLRVTKIVRRYNGVKVTVEDGRTFIADAAIVAVPLGVLKSNCIKFEPRLPEWKEAAINDLGVGIENKIILHFEKVFWPNVEFLGVVAGTTYECSYFLNLHKATGHSVLVYMPAGQLARDIEKMSDEAAANFAFTQLKRILPNASAPVMLHFMLILLLCNLRTVSDALYWKYYVLCFCKCHVPISTGDTDIHKIYVRVLPHTQEETKHCLQINLVMTGCMDFFPHFIFIATCTWKIQYAKIFACDHSKYVNFGLRLDYSKFITCYLTHSLSHTLKALCLNKILQIP